MTGVGGVLGRREHGVDWLAADLRWTGTEDVAAFDDEHVAVRSVFHPGRKREQPATTRDDALVWVWGDLWGFDGPEGYRSARTDPAGTAAEFCARRYEEHGIGFVDGLNGNFAAVIYDRDDRLVHLVTDRLATHPVYHARPHPGTVVFSSQIQSLPRHPAVESGFDVEYLCEYLALGSVGGVRTPLRGVEELQPSSVTTVDLDAGAVETERYWRPRFDPIDAPFSSFVDRFVDRFERVLDDRLDPETEYGLLLSGGSDSRVILAGVDADVDLHTYHATDWLSEETRAAERAALTADRDFRLLMRDRDNHARMLETAPPYMNFVGRFKEAHITEFGDRLRGEVDVLISGLGADTLFREHAFAVPRVGLGPFGDVPLPLIRRTKSVEEHIARRARELPGYLDTTERLDEILRRNIEVDAGGRISHHGVVCESVDELVFFDDFYPFSNKSDFFFHALNGTMPHWSPFYDNRLVDLALRVPLRHRMRRNLIDATTTVLDESLAAVPHGTTGVALSRPFPANMVLWYAKGFARELLLDEAPQPHLEHGPWVDTAGLIRSHEFVGETLRERESLMDRLPFLDGDGAFRLYEEHLGGADNSFELYTLLSFLGMPVVERIATESAGPLDRRPE